MGANVGGRRASRLAARGAGARAGGRAGQNSRRHMRWVGGRADGQIDGRMARRQARRQARKQACRQARGARDGHVAHARAARAARERRALSRGRVGGLASARRARRGQTVKTGPPLLMKEVHPRGVLVSRPCFQFKPLGGPSRAPSVHLWICLRGLLSTWACAEICEIGFDRLRPILVNFGPISAESGASRSNSRCCWQSAAFCQESRIVGQLGRPPLARMGPNLGPKMPTIAPNIGNKLVWLIHCVWRNNHSGNSVERRTLRNIAHWQGAGKISPGAGQIWAGVDEFKSEIGGAVSTHTGHF